MSFKLAGIDQLATSHPSFLQKWSSRGKVVGTAVLLLGIVAATNWRQIVVFLNLLVAIVLTAKLPVWLFSLALYPAIFSLPFALSKLSVSVAEAATVVGKATTAALLLALLVASTPYPQIFGALSRVLPPVLTDALFLAYRLFFLVVGSLERLLLSLRQRGAFGKGNFCWSFRVTLHAIGYLIANTLRLSQRLEQNYRLRGYGVRIYWGAEPYVWRMLDLAMLLVLICLVGGVLCFA
ncbi:MAG: hypothetical protein GX060_00640 [Firmicutes bacterium]|nr:hypothetical protein [Bacillota bacterium]